MEVMERLGADGHEMVVFCRDAASGLRAIVAIHDTTLGQGMGGCRMRDYPDEASALEDALRLSRGMTFKFAAAGLPHGGAKAVIVGDPECDKSPALLAAFGDFVERLGGAYVTAEDAGTTTADIRRIALRTRFVRNLPLDHTEDGGIATATGVRHAMIAALTHVGRPGLRGVSVMIEGAGKVGAALAGLLHADGARLLVADVDRARAAGIADTYGAEVVEAGQAIAAAADIYAPCALGGTLDRQAVGILRARIVAGAANNQLAEPAVARLLRERGIVYCPDYVANAGGVLSLVPQGEIFDRGRAMARVATVGATTAAVLAAADRAGSSTSEAADRMVQERLAAARSRRDQTQVG